MTVPQKSQRPQNPNGVSRDVEQELFKQRAEKRRRNGGASPVEYQKSLTVGDDWNCLFLNHLSRGVTMHTYEQPPKNVLDLGCGTGLWAIEAAKCWPTSTIVGFDIRSIQPDLTLVNLGIEYRELAGRVKWVHGDFLDPLPFESGHFDLVRICCIGLNVPEDSWQDILEECARVLRPGGSIEIIEEDLLFPAGRTRKPDPERTSSSHSMLRASGERMRSDSTASRLTTQTSQTTRTATSTSSQHLYTTEHSSQGSNSLDSFLTSSSHPHSDPSDELFAQDHPRLKEAWEEMLSQRFLTHKLLNVLPFYLSSCFTNVHVHPTMHVVLPPPSSQTARDRRKTAERERERERELERERERERPMRADGQDQDIAHWVQDMRAHAVRLSTSDSLQQQQQQQSKKAAAAALRSSKPSVATITLWSALHLARQMHLVAACKEAIWEAYCALMGAAREAFLHPDDAAREPPREDLREEFEREWAAWEGDMKDRIGMREHMQEAIAWEDAEALSVRSGSGRASLERPTRVPQIQNPDWDLSDKTALCRSMRGFIAWKPAA
ncbi:S-adenosyl-L-methionine-dependent methyltransferase [Pilatotrama ljubarskyi]|nr:S-adenosyl-L-methionine-dependent methyltransferase [Pilatotrama ljubarskyi]